jgi:NodT family efflux transporter outer membrane factor (OMF) lipoprotein
VCNGFKVGPNYGGLVAESRERWIDDGDLRVRRETANLARWWSVFQDPVLDDLIESAQRQNLSLREAGFRILQARAHLAITVGNLFPQSQHANGSYRHSGTPLGPQIPMEVEVGGLSIPLTLRSQQNYLDQWNLGFNLAWELDLWGRYRRAVMAAQDTLDASAADYDGVLVTLLGDVAALYVQIRTLEQRAEFVRQNVAEQRKIAGIIERIYEVGGDPRKGYPPKRLPDVYQIKSVLAQTESHMPQLQLELREASNRLCILLGLPPTALQERLGRGAIPVAPAEVVVGIPADLLRRRPDVRRVESQAAAQAERIGIAEADLYPMFALSGVVGLQAETLPQLLSAQAFHGSLGPSFQWNILNYGRILNNMRLQEARFGELVTVYQHTVLRANAEVENGIARFLRAQERSRALDVSADFAERAVREIEKLHAVGWRGFDANQLAVITLTKVQQQDLQAQAHGEIAQGLIQVYRALGGGWETAARPAEPTPVAPRAAPSSAEEVPAPPAGLSTPRT